MIEGIVASIFGKIVADDIRDGMPSILRKLVLWAVAKLPAQRQERMLEEWTGHLSAIPGILPKICTAVNFIFAARSIASHDRKIKKQKLLELQALWLLHIFIELLEAELISRPGHQYVRGGDFMDYLNKVGVSKISIMAATFVFSKGWNIKTLPEAEEKRARSAMQKAVCIVLDGVNTKNAREFGFYGLAFEVLKIFLSLHRGCCL